MSNFFSFPSERPELPWGPAPYQRQTPRTVPRDSCAIDSRDYVTDVLLDFLRVYFREQLDSQTSFIHVAC
jgi:hypothetical protein